MRDSKKQNERSREVRFRRSVTVERERVREFKEGLIKHMHFHERFEKEIYGGSEPR